MTAPPRRWSGWNVDIPFVVFALVCGATLLYLGRSLTFWHDEWRSITFDGGPLDYLRPVNQHWSTFPLVLYRATLAIVGLRSYVPYLAELIVLHLLAVGAAYALMRERVGPHVATLAAIPLLLLGSGAENLFWAFQTGFVGSVMFGLWALFFLERSTRRAAPIASLLLLASLMSSGIGLFFLVVAGSRTILDPSLRSRAVVVAPPFGAYLLWFGLVGRDQVGDGRIFLELSTIRFVVRGIVHATESVSGLGHLPEGHLWGLIAFVALSLVVAHRILRGRPRALATGCVLGVTAMYVVISFVRVRADPGYDHATSSRFVYVAAFLLVLAVVDVLPERGAWATRGRRLGIVVPAALMLGLVWSIAANVDALRAKRLEFQRTAKYTRAFVEQALVRGREPWVDRQAPRGWMPSVEELERTVARYGSPLRDELFPGIVEAPGPADEEAALLALIGDGFRLDQPRGRTSGYCSRARLTPGTAAWIDVLPPGARVRARSSSPLAGRIFLAHEGGPGRPIYTDFEAHTPKDIVIPDIGDGRPWTLVVDSPASAGVVRLCVLGRHGVASAHGLRITVRHWE